MAVDDGWTYRLYRRRVRRARCELSADKSWKRNNMHEKERHAPDIDAEEWEEAIALDLDERERLVRDLGEKDVMVLKHHGLLIVGTTVAEPSLDCITSSRRAVFRSPPCKAGRRSHCRRIMSSPMPPCRRTGTGGAKATANVRGQPSNTASMVSVRTTQRKSCNRGTAITRTPGKKQVTRSHRRGWRL